MRHYRHIVSAVFVLATGVFAFLFLSSSHAANDPSLLFTPSTGSYAVDNTFDVSIAINTQGQNINAFKAKLYFPPDRLQVVSSNTGKSITGFWIRSPSYSNETGVIELEGAIPTPGVNTSFGIIATITFRVRSLGTATIRFDESSSLYLNDGEGTQVNVTFQNGLYNLVLPPPAGPIVTSPTHPDQTKWYKANDAVFQWANLNPVEGYSYLLNSTPVDLPDNVAEGAGTDTVYKSLPDGIYYFHIKALRSGVWGGVTHYGLKIQNGNPAGFAVDTSPGTRTSSKTVVFSFGTTDPLSGLSHYEAKIIRRDVAGVGDNSRLEPFFFEVHSPYILKADDYGRYDFVVRAYNNAGNFAEATAQVSIVKPIFQFIAGEGFRVGDWFVIPWYLSWIIFGIIVLILLAALVAVYRWHERTVHGHDMGIGRNDLNTEKLAEMRDRFGALKILAWMILIPLLVLFRVPSADAASLAPPVINLISQNITNEDIFYVGGRAAAGSSSKVVIYLEALSTGQTYSFEAPVSAVGDWLYTHNSFLESGTYLIWTQLKIADQASPPSGQMQMSVAPTAIQLGASRLSYETIYLALVLVFVVVSAVLAAGIFWFWRKGQRRRNLLLTEVREAEEAIIRGFVLLRKDIESELRLVHQIKSAQELSQEEQAREKQLLDDFEEINRHIEKEVWDIEKALG